MRVAVQFTYFYADQGVQPQPERDSGAGAWRPGWRIRKRTEIGELETPDTEIAVLAMQCRARIGVLRDVSELNGLVRQRRSFDGVIGMPVSDVDAATTVARERFAAFSAEPEIWSEQKRHLIKVLQVESDSVLDSDEVHQKRPLQTEAELLVELGEI